MTDHGAPDFASRYGAWALVAGASDGLGEAYAHEAASRGLNVVLLARREGMLKDVASHVEGRHGVKTKLIVADLTSPDLGDVVSESVAGLKVGLLIYNAGAEPKAAKFLDRPLEDARTLINLSCHGPATLAHLLGQPMKARGRGGMVFTSSMAAMAGTAYVATYAATKSFDIIFAEGLWQELQGEGIDVLSVIAGATKTPSLLRSVESSSGRADLQMPDAVAREALDHLGVGPSCVPGDGNKQAAAYLWPRSRVAISTMMSQATAQMYGLPETSASGQDFSEGEPG